MTESTFPSTCCRDAEAVSAWSGAFGIVPWTSWIDCSSLPVSVKYSLLFEPVFLDADACAMICSALDIFEAAERLEDTDGVGRISIRDFGGRMESLEGWRRNGFSSSFGQSVGGSGCGLAGPCFTQLSELSLFLVERSFSFRAKASE